MLYETQAHTIVREHILCSYIMLYETHTRTTRIRNEYPQNGLTVRIMCLSMCMCMCMCMSCVWRVCGPWACMREYVYVERLDCAYAGTTGTPSEKVRFRF